MDQNLTNQQPSLSKNKKIPSWILGIIGLLLVGFCGIIAWGADYFLTQLLTGGVISEGSAYNLMSVIWVVYQIIVFIVLIFGLIKGIKELKTLKKKSATVGIILCSVSIILLILLDFLLLLSGV